MSNELHAHIFGRSRSGDREAVKMKLYHPNGEEFEPGSTVTGRVWSGKGLPTLIGADDDFYIDIDTGNIYGPKIAGAWPAAINNPGLSTKLLDVAGIIDMAPAYPAYHIDCAGKTVVHGRRFLINSAPSNKEVYIFLDNLKLGTPYRVTVENYSTYTHKISLAASNVNLIDDLVVAGKTKSSTLLLPPDEICSIMSLYTAPVDRPVAMVTQQPRAPRRDVTANYACTDYDLNGLIVANSANPLTITVRDQNLGDWWKGEEIEVYQAGTGVVTIAAPGGTSLLRPGGLTGNFAMPGGRYSTVKLRAVEFLKWALC